MGCCIPRKQYISISTATTNKKKLSKNILKKHAKSYEFSNKHKYSPFSKLEQYYRQSPILDIDLSFSSESLFFDSSKDITGDNVYNVYNEKNQKKIKSLMKKLRDLSSSEVNNCKKYFMANKKCIKN